MAWKVKREYNSLRIEDEDGIFLSVKIEHGKISIQENNSGLGYGVDGFLERYEFNQNDAGLINTINKLRAKKMKGEISIRDFYGALDAAFDDYQMINEFICEKYLEIDQ